MSDTPDPAFQHESALIPPAAPGLCRRDPFCFLLRGGEARGLTYRMERGGAGAALHRPRDCAAR